MSRLVIIEAVASIVAGRMLVEIAFAATSRSWCERLLRFSLGALLGLGILSASYAVIMFAGLGRGIEAALPLGLAAASGGLLVWRRGLAQTGVSVPHMPHQSGGTDTHVCAVLRLLRILFLCAAIVAAVTAVEHTLREPEGGFDAWAIWNARARALFRAASPATEAFSPVLARAQFRTHTDYPLLVPGLVVEGFRSIDGESVAVPATVAIIFAILLTAIVLLGIADLLGEKWGLLCGSILLSAPIFVTLTVRQCADVPLTAYVFAATLIAVIAVRTGTQERLSLIALAGFTLSFAAWCKNEGIVFMLAIPIAFLMRPPAEARIGSRERAAEALAWTAGALPLLVLLIVFKIHIAPPGDIISGSGGDIIHRLITPSRWATIALALMKRIVAINEWGLHLLATIAAIIGILASRRRLALDPMARAIAISLMLVMLSFGAVYLLSPHDLAWHVRYSFDRLAFQCWPSALLAMCIALAGIFDAASPPNRANLR